MPVTISKKDERMKVEIIKQTMVNKANAKVGSVHEVSQSVGNLLIHTKKAVAVEESEKKSSKKSKAKDDAE